MSDFFPAQCPECDYEFDYEWQGDSPEVCPLCGYEFSEDDIEDD